ncbi:hypothetical protein [Streptomyces sp. NPDC088910]|uniref:hypothetical protein n=1 Tax=Streptomyces sp. NPDC088910 TaxID=3365911 RepID=UPI0038304EF1
MLPLLGYPAAGVVGRLLDWKQGTFVLVTLTLCGLGQASTWLGMDGLRRTHGWASGVFFYVLAGGLLNAILAACSGIPFLGLVPLLAPATAWLAKVRLRRKPPAEAAR